MIATTDLLHFLETELYVDVEELEPDSPLFSSGILDSFKLVSLMGFVAEQTRIEIDEEDVTLDNFDSVKRILVFVERQSPTSE